MRTQLLERVATQERSDERPVAAVAGPGGPGGPGGRDGWRGDGAGQAPPAAAWQTGVWLLLAAVSMLFVGFTAAYLVRRGQPDWEPGPLPPVLWVNTAVLALSSAALEWGRLRGRRGRPVEELRGYVAAAGLGALFLVGQLIAWRQMVRAGWYLQSNPHSSYFYVLTAVHGLHVAAGLSWLCVAAWRLRRTPWSPGDVGPQAMAGAAGVFWHFMGAVWLYVFALLSVMA